jgi:seryl-tRNA synthetase
MIYLNYLRENADLVTERLKIKNFDATAYVQDILSVDLQRRKTQKELDDNLSEQNSIAKQIGILFKEGKTDMAQSLKERSAALKILAKEMEELLITTENRINELLVLLPNLPHQSVPAGHSAEDNEIVYSEGDTEVEEGILPHWDICEKLNLVDFETGVKITGSGFPLYKAGSAIATGIDKFLFRQRCKVGIYRNVISLCCQ